MKQWMRKPLGMIPFAVWLGLYYAGSFTEYWTMFIFQALVVAATTYFFAYYWSAFYKKGTRQVDSLYHYPKLYELQDAHTYALDMMDMEYPRDYVDRWCDCDDFAEAVCFFMKQWFRENMTHKGKGLAIAPFGYDKEASGKGHVCVEALSDIGSIYFEVYQGFGQLHLTKKERGSAQWLNF